MSGARRGRAAAPGGHEPCRTRRGRQVSTTDEDRAYFEQIGRYATRHPWRAIPAGGGKIYIVGDCDVCHYWQDARPVTRVVVWFDAETGCRHVELEACPGSAARRWRWAAGFPGRNEGPGAADCRSRCDFRPDRGIPARAGLPRLLPWWTKSEYPRMRGRFTAARFSSGCTIHLSVLICIFDTFYCIN